MLNFGRDDRKLRMIAELQNQSTEANKHANLILNEVEDELEIERKRMGFMVYYGRFMVIDAVGNYWFERTDGQYNWKTDIFRSPQGAIDAAMAHVNWGA
jgi:hypothetical protein